MLIDSMSLGLSVTSGLGGVVRVRPALPTAEPSMSFSIGKPSMTYSGSEFPVIDDVPRMRMDSAPPGSLDAVVTETPGAVPWSTWSIDAIGARSSASVVTVEMAPVTSRRSCVP
jgi:hypothetical protein